MNLEELAASVEEVEVKEGEVLPAEDSADIEQDLTDALNLLEDCGDLLEALVKMKGKMTPEDLKTLRDLAEEVSVFMARYDPEVELKAEWWDETVD